MDYAQALEKALAAANSGQAQAAMAADIAAGNNTYNKLAEQAAANRLMEEARLMQRMVDLGVTASPSLTVQNNMAMAGMRDTGDVRRQNQVYTDVQNAMIAQANANATAQAAGITANMNAAEGASVLGEETSKFETYYNLAAAGKMTRSAFKKLTGIDFRMYKPKVKKQEPPKGPPFDDATEAMARQMYTAYVKGKAEGDALERYYNGDKFKTSYENQQAKRDAQALAASYKTSYENLQAMRNAQAQAASYRR